MALEPAVSVTDWLKLPAFCRKATWLPWGALGLPEVKPLALPETPACPTKVHGEAVGSYTYADGPEPTDGVSKPASCNCAGGGWAVLRVTWSMKAAFWPPLGLRPRNVMVWTPAATGKTLVAKVAEEVVAGVRESTTTPSTSTRLDRRLL